MLASRQSGSPRLWSPQSLLPAGAGALMLCASALPWLQDPLQGAYSAWGLPIDLGWQFHIVIINYGLLCLCCAIYAFLVSYATTQQRYVGHTVSGGDLNATTYAPFPHWKPSRWSNYFVQKHVTAAFVCILPVLLFLLQYLCADVVGIQALTEHVRQFLLIEHHFGYNLAGVRIPLQPFTLDTSTLDWRFALLIDQVSVGVLLPVLSFWMLLYCRRFFVGASSAPGSAPTPLAMSPTPLAMSAPLRSATTYAPFPAPLRSATTYAPFPAPLRSARHTPPSSARFSASHALGMRGRRAWVISILLCIFIPLIVLGRAPAAMFCEYQASAALEAGDYQPALGWLNIAVFLNPALDQTAYYHIERGQAMYFLTPAHQGDDSHVYLAFTYRQQGDYLDAYQELLALWHAQPTSPWVVSEVDITLERLAEYIQPASEAPRVPAVARADNDESALPWLELLAQVDPSSVYSHYVIGRIEYDLHNYGASMAQMGMVIQLSDDSDVQSSAYTYIALSDAGQGNYVDSRKFLFKALELDPGYHNNTAREELSGLR